MTEFKHGETVCNGGELFYVHINSEGEQTFPPLHEGQHKHYSSRRTYPVLQAAQESLFSISKIPDGTLFTMKEGYLWAKTEDGWKGVLYRSLSFDVWFSSSMVRIYPAIPKNGYISKKEASCVGS